MDTLLQDLRYGIRQLLRSPGFTLVAVLTLALGIGANTAIFSVVDQVLLRRLPVSNPAELVVLRSPGPAQGRIQSDTDDAEIFTYPMYRRLRDRSREVADLVARFEVSANVVVENEPERVSSELVSGNYFQVLGAPPELGRVFTLEDETTPGGNPVVVLSHGFWARRFGGDEGILNQKILINGHPMVIVGVAGERFTGVQLGLTPDLWVPLSQKAQMTPNWNGLDDPKDYWLAVLGRLRPGVSRTRAETALTAAYRPLLEEDLAYIRGWPEGRRQEFLNKQVELLPGARGRLILQRDAEGPLLALLAMVGLVLLIACANVANLLIARGISRQREISIRLALGASRPRLVRQLTTESLLLALAACLGGILAAWWSSDVLIRAVSENFEIQGLSASLNLRVLGFALAASLVTAMLFGLLPAWRVSGAALVTALKNHGGAASPGPMQMGLRRILVSAQVAFTVVLLVEAGLFAHTLLTLSRQQLGVRTERLLTFAVSPSLSGYSPERTRQFFDQLTEEIRALPGVNSVSTATVPIFANSSSNSNITVEGYELQPDERVGTRTNHVGPGYFATLGIPLLTGRDLTSQDTSESARVAVVNQAFVRRYFRDGVAVGRRFAFGSGDRVRPDIEIVGVVQNSRHANVREEVQPFAYLPYTQEENLGRITFYVRTAGPPEGLANAVRSRVFQLAPGIPVYQMKTLEQQISQLLFADQLVTVLSLSFGLLAALLAAVGIAGVMAYSVARRTREIGIRIALGARPDDVFALILKESVPMVAGGIALGLPLAYGLARLTESLLFGATAADWPAVLAAVVSMATVALLAASWPARRAARVDPMVALRYE